MNKLRVSYSLLNMWEKDKNEAIENYLHKASEKTEAQLHGLRRHKHWQTTIKKDKKLTLGETVHYFLKPEVEREIIKDYNDRFLVKGYIDVLDNGVIYEFKTGGTSAAQYSNTYQIPFYFMLCEMAGVDVSHALVIHEDLEGTIDTALVWNWKERVDEAKNYIDSLAPEIYEYFISHSIPL